MKKNSIGQLRRDLDSLAQKQKSLDKKLNIMGAVFIICMLGVAYTII